MPDSTKNSTLPATDCCGKEPTKLPGATVIQSNGGDRGGSSGRGEWIAKFGALLSAIIASSCCWLPPLLILAGVSGAGMASTLETYRPAFMLVTFGFLGTAFYFTYRPRRVVAAEQDCCAAQTSAAGESMAQGGKPRFNMMAMNKAMLWVVTVAAVAFLFFPQYFTGMLVAGNDQFTADMTRTVLTVEGMTCDG